ncbi:MAG: FAD-dependent oxidoreductase [Deltaproteobacteria bacterium]|nr:MAG: FAD-dependent oxidoreductase [Deltaproteobacteria bacterium]
MPAERICVIGAGPCGLTAAKSLLEAGFTDLTLVDRGGDVGGNWVFDEASGHSSVFETTHIISSKRYSTYLDHDFPPGTADYPSHHDLASYFQSYAERFGLYRHLERRTLVTQAEPLDAGGFIVHTQSELDGSTQSRQFDKLVVANGHHWKPRWPDYPGTFTGDYLHSHDFKRAEPFRDKRVLVIGGGNSACDIAVETSRISARTDLSWRRGYWVVPKFVFGRPADHLHHKTERLLQRLPLKVRMRSLERLLKVINGPNSLYGLPEPDHHFGETHPTINSELLYFLRHGKINPQPDIERFDGHTVTFADGTRQDYDAVVACTGYWISHPFFDPDFIDYSHGPVPLYLKMLHPKRDDLVFIGLFQPLGCIWPCAELQSRIVARWWTGQWQPPPDRAAAIRRELARPHLQQVASPRHTITVDEPTFRRRLIQELDEDPLVQAARDRGAPLPS